MATVPRDWIELAIIAFILAGIGLTFWKAGSANPESTGSLGKKVNAIVQQGRHAVIAARPPGERVHRAQG
jgi:hypothetical protein